MNKENYIELRQNGNLMGILFEAAKERKYTGDILTLTALFMSWKKAGPYKESLIASIIDFYDTKFSLVCIYYNGNLIKITD